MILRIVKLGYSILPAGSLSWIGSTVSMHQNGILPMHWKDWPTSASCTKRPVCSQSSATQTAKMAQKISWRWFSFQGNLNRRSRPSSKGPCRGMVSMPIQKMFFDPCSWMMTFQFVTKRSGRFWKFDMARGRRGKSLGSQGKKKEERKAAVRKKQGKIGRGKKAKKSKKEKIDPVWCWFIDHFKIIF